MKKVLKIKSNVPIGVKIIAIMYYLGAVSSVIFSLPLFFIALLIGPTLNQVPLLGAIAGGLTFLLGISLIGFGVLCFFIGKGLWNTRPWTRNAAIIFAIIGILIGIIFIIRGELQTIFSFLVNGIIAGYLLFNNSVKEAFA